MDPLTHLLVGLWIGLLWRLPEGVERRYAVIAAAVAAMAADVELLGMLYKGRPAEVFEMWAMFHSIFGVVAIGAGAALLTRAPRAMAPMTLLAALSHPALDALTPFRPLWLAPFADWHLGTAVLAPWDPVTWVVLALPLIGVLAGRLGAPFAGKVSFGLLAIWIAVSGFFTMSARDAAAEAAAAAGIDEAVSVRAWPIGPLDRAVAVYGVDLVAEGVAGPGGIEGFDRVRAHNLGDPVVEVALASTRGYSFRTWAEAPVARVGYSQDDYSKIMVELVDLRAELGPASEPSYLARLRLGHPDEDPKAWKVESTSWRRAAVAKKVIGIDVRPKKGEREAPADK